MIFEKLKLTNMDKPNGKLILKGHNKLKFKNKDTGAMKEKCPKLKIKASDINACFNILHLLEVIWSIT